jgi:hypothetical protein
MQSNSKARDYDAPITWAGSGQVMDNFEWSSMIDIEFYLSNTRIEYKLRLDNFITVLAKFGGLMSTFLLVFTLIG